MAKGASGPAKGATQAVAALNAAGIGHRLHEFEHDPGVRGFGLEAAEVLGQQPERVFKTLVVKLDRGLGVGIVPVDQKLAMKAIAAALGSKRAELADQAEAERVTGYVRGGISPFGQKRLLPTAVDRSALDHPTIMVSGGRRGLEIELDPVDLVRLLAAVTAPITG